MEFQINSALPGCFTYNALGQRVQKHVGSPASDTYYYYDAFGNLAMTKGASQVNEYLFPGNFGKYYWTGSAWETDYTHKNRLGSTQVVTRADGSPAEYEIFFPYGGMRWGPAGGTQDVRFASMQERDLETQGWQDPLDPTWFRLYGSGMGRWFSPDPLAGDITNPQSLNRYAYVLNNPTTLTDPSGLSPCPYGASPSGQGQCVGFAQNGLGVAFPPLSGEYSCNVDGVETNCGVIDQVTHGSTLLMFESMVGQAIAKAFAATPPKGYIPVGSGDQEDCPGCYVGVVGAETDKVWNPMDHVSVPLLPLLAGGACVAAEPCGAGTAFVVGTIATLGILAYSNKDAIKHIVGLMNQVDLHIGKLETNPDQDPRNKWRTEIRDKIKAARKWGNRMSPGKAQDIYMRLIDAAEAAIPED